MKPEPHDKQLERFADAIKALIPHDFTPVGLWKFRKSGKTHDLSATDLGWAIKNIK